MKNRMSAADGAQQYMDAIRNLLEQISATQEATIALAAITIGRSLRQGGVLYLCGTGHSHMLAEEGHYRAGGLAPVCPILSAPLMLHESALASSRFERTSGVAAALLSRYPLKARDTIIVFSNSGANAFPVEVALIAKEKGLSVIAVVALDYAATVPAGATGRKLADVADIVIDNLGVPGDALVEIPGTTLRTGASSTISGAFILNAILTEVTWQMAAGGITPPVYISANMPGAAAHNAVLVERYRVQNPHL